MGRVCRLFRVVKTTGSMLVSWSRSIYLHSVFSIPTRGRRVSLPGTGTTVPCLHFDPPTNSCCCSLKRPLTLFSPTF